MLFLYAVQVPALQKMGVRVTQKRDGGITGVNSYLIGGQSLNSIVVGIIFDH
jgi:hypothetical protein